MAFPIGWGRKCKLTIDHTKISGEANLENFPVLLTEANFPSTIFDHTKSGGADLRFSSDEAGATELPLEVVVWDQDNDKAEVWVKLASISYETDTSFYVWYDNPGAVAYEHTDTYGTHAVWNNGFVAVYHLQSSGADSGPNSYDTAAGDAPEYAAGKIQSGGDFEKDNTDYLVILDANCPNLEIAGSQTWTAWYKPETVNTTCAIASKSGTNYKQLYIQNASPTMYMGGLSASLEGTNNLSAGTFYKVTGSYDATAHKLYVWMDTSKESSAELTGTPADTNGNFHIGDTKDFNASADGIIDELTISNVLRTDGWIVTEYNNTNSPETFTTEGTEEILKSMKGFLSKGFIQVAR